MLEDNYTKVKLQIYYEQGMEGVEWSAHDPTKEGWEGLIILNPGNYLIVNDIWEGTIKYNYSINKIWVSEEFEEYANAGQYRQILELRNYTTKTYSDKECKRIAERNLKRQIVGGYKCNWLQDGVDPLLWLSMFKKELPAYYKNNVNNIS
jgi:hypothetical protein